jgi:hypothetical protein
MVVLERSIQLFQTATGKVTKHESLQLELTAHPVSSDADFEVETQEYFAILLSVCAYAHLDTGVYILN